MQRYYTYSVANGRRRVPDRLTGSLEQMIDHARSVGSANLVGEDGTASKPFGHKVIWRAEA